jgi:tRNA1(Val) A37 N6-methylase TrmN6
LTVRELVRTNNAVLVSAVGALLDGAGIPHLVLDRHMSVLEGSLGILPCRILVDDEHHQEARRVLEDAGLAHELPPLPEGELPPTTDDAILGGRVRLIQPQRGHRVGHDAVLLAAATPARPQDHVVELGAGVGAAGLALAIRVPDARLALVEIDPALAEIAAANIARNGMQARARVAVVDIAGGLEKFAAAGLPSGCADRVMMNPPFNDPAAAQVSPDPQRMAAHSAPRSALAQWVDAARTLLHSAGTLSMIWRADGLADVLAALMPGFGGIVILPVHGRPGRPAIRVLVRATKQSRAPLTLLPPLMLNDDRGRPTAEADRVLRDAAPLPLAEM